MKQRRAPELPGDHRQGRKHMRMTELLKASHKLNYPMKRQIYMTTVKRMDGQEGEWYYRLPILQNGRDADHSVEEWLLILNFGPNI
eukprot:4348381-Pleurochrysis_carterae.AAC.1